MSDKNLREVNPFHFTAAEAFSQEYQRSLLVGRDKELKDLLRHFRRNGPRLAAISGPRGTGRTSLAYMIRDHPELRDRFPDGFHYIHATPFTDMVPEFFGEAYGRKPRPESSLLIVDDYEAGSEAFRSVLWDYMRRNVEQSLLLCCSEELPIELSDALVITLGGLQRHEFLALLERRLNLGAVDEHKAARLFELVAGNPLFADLASKSIREHLLTLSEFIQGLEPFSHSTLVGPDGEPIGEVPRPVKLVVVDTNRILLERIRANPEEVYSLGSREFEELVADILREKGYDVTLTPPSGDGGFDMFAARKDDLGSFLFLVECKRYIPPNKVGVSVVRALHGVVQQRQANAGIVVTSSFFTKGAREFQEDVPHQMQLRDYFVLQKWLGII